MLNPENLRNAETNRPTASTLKFASAIAKLATFIEYHCHHSDERKVPGANDVAEIRRSDAEIANHLGISLVALEHAFAELISENVIKLRDAYKIEIVNRDRLYEFAHRKA